MKSQVDESKWIPAGYRIKVKLRDVESNYDSDEFGNKITKSASGLIVEVKKKRDIEREQFAVQVAEVIQVGLTAWKGFDDGEAWCKVGDVVLIAKYAGVNREDPITGDIYSIIDDRDIIAYQRGNND